MGRKKSKVEPPPRPSRDTGETRAAEAATVAWMMSVITTVLCGVIGVALVLATRARPAGDGARMFGGLLHFSGLMSAVVTLLLTPVVLKFRRQAPPASITWFAVSAALAVVGSALLHYL